MVRTAPSPLDELYHRDETAWLEAMAALAAEGRVAELDLRNLSEYLSDMATRDRREVFSRLVVLLNHLLKWEFQPERRSESWISTIFEQRQELREIIESAVLRAHAVNVLPKAYASARKRAAAETGLPLQTFPTEFSRDLDAILCDDDAE